MEELNEWADGDPGVARVELEIVNHALQGGFRWRYRLSLGANIVEREMYEQCHPLGLFEAALRGALDAMGRVGEGEAVRIEAPTYPLVLGMTRWVHRWRVNGWRNRFGVPVRQRELWETLWLLSVERHVEWIGSTMLPVDWREFHNP